MKPYIGAAYYPELWDKKEIVKDIKRMKDIGINLVRIAEFAWAYIEPEEGRFDLDWLHEIITILEKNNIDVMLCTPTAAPPSWLTSKYPEVLAKDSDGRAYVHGSRRHYCHNTPKYIEFSDKITEKLAKEFSNYSGVVAWHLDNEFGCHIRECYCDNCRRKFQEWLKQVYGTIDNLNAKWGTGVWSQRYDDFSQVPLPQKTPSTHNPSLLFRYKNFMSTTFSQFAHRQADIIRKYTKTPVTTNGMPAYHEIDYEEMYGKLDFIAMDLYTLPGNFHEIAFEYDWMRPFKKNKPFWLIETSATSAGGLVPWSILTHKPGALRCKMWTTFAMGGEAVAFWLWRSQWSGQEMEHGSVTYSWGEYTLAEEQIRRVVAESQKARDFLNETKPPEPEVAIHYSYQSIWIFNYGHTAKEFTYLAEMYKYYSGFLFSNINRDLVYPGADISKYKTVFSPFQPIFSKKMLGKMEKFLENGGTWIIGPLSGFRTEDVTAYKTAAYGPLEDMLNIHVRHRLPPDEQGKPISIDWKGIGKSNANFWLDAYEPKSGNKVIASYSNGPVKGMPAIIETKAGKGKAIVFGTLPDKLTFMKWLNLTQKANKTPFLKAFSDGIVIIPRLDKNNLLKGAFLLNLTENAGKVVFSKECRDLFTGRILPAELDIAPYEVFLVQRTT